MPRSHFSIDHLLGPHCGCFAGYASDPDVRHNAASGGAVSAITRYLLQKGIVRGVMASRLHIMEGELVPETILARSIEDLKDCKNSIYFDFHIGSDGRFRELMRELEAPGRLAVVGLHCHLETLRHMMESRGIDDNRIIKIGLFCSHAPDKRLVQKVLARVGADLKRAVRYHTKTGGIGKDGRIHGTSTVVYADGTSLIFPFLRFTTYKNAWFFAHEKCLICEDQFAENADVSCGDAWYRELRSEPVKYTTLIARNYEMRDLLLDMAREGLLVLRSVDPYSVVYSQRRVTGIAKVSTAARTRLAPLFGIGLPKRPGKARFIDYLHSFLVLLNVRISKSRRLRDLIFFPPTFLMFGYVAVIKLIEQRLLSGLPRGKGVGPIITGHSSTMEQVDKRNSI